MFFSLSSRPTIRSEEYFRCILSSGMMIDMKDLCVVTRKAAWMAYLDIYSLDADGALFDAALLSGVAAFSHRTIPIVSLNDDGRIVVSKEGKNV